MNNREAKERLSGFRQVSVRIVMLYSILGGLWIVFSDRLLDELVVDPSLHDQLQTAKGWLYVAITAVFLYWLINRGQAEIERAALIRWESEKRFQSLFEAVPISIWETDLSEVKAELDNLQAQQIKDYGAYFAKRPDFLRQLQQHLKIIDVNATTLDIFAAQSPAELFGGLNRVFTPEALPAFRDALKAIAEGRERFDAEVPVLTLRGECKTFFFTLTIPSDSAKFRNVPICVMDVTVRRRTEETLRLLESAVRQVRESITITTSDLDHPGPTIVFVNPAFTAMTGYSAEEAIGKTPRILHGPKTDLKMLSQMKQRLWQRQTFRCETINYRKDGTEFINEWNVAPIIDKNHEVTHFVAVQRDITERKEAEEEIRRLNEDLRRRAEELEAVNARFRELGCGS